MKKHEIVLAAFEEQRGTLSCYSRAVYTKGDSEVRELATKD